MLSLSLLPAIWLGLIAGAWALHLGLGGAETGATMLGRRLRDGDVGRVIGPTWQANDVWLIVAVASMFGAFPGWYAAWAQGLYGPLVAAILALVVRHAGVELAPHAGPAGRRRWGLAIVAASWTLPIVWGVAWAAALDGSLGRGGLGVLSVHGLAAGVALALVWRATGAAYLASRGRDAALRASAARSLRRTAPLAAAAGGVAGVLVALGAARGVALGAGSATAAGAGAVLLAVLGAAGRAGRARVALWAGGLAVAAGLAAVVLALAPLGIAGPDGVSLAREASGTTTLGLMTAVAAVVAPALVAAQVWAYGRFDRAGGAPRADGAARGLSGLAERALEGLR